MVLSEKERQFIKHYQTHHKVYILMFIFIILFASVQFYLVFNKFIPVYTATLQKSPKLSHFVFFGLAKMVGISFPWIALLVGNLIGEFITHKRIKSLLNKLVSYVEEK